MSNNRIIGSSRNKNTDSSFRKKSFTKNQELLLIIQLSITLRARPLPLSPILKKSNSFAKRKTLTTMKNLNFKSKRNGELKKMQKIRRRGRS